MAPADSHPLISVAQDPDFDESDKKDTEKNKEQYEGQGYRKVMHPDVLLLSLFGGKSFTSRLTPKRKNHRGFGLPEARAEWMPLLLILHRMCFPVL